MTNRTIHPYLPAVGNRCPMCGRKAVTEGQCSSCGNRTASLHHEIAQAAPQQPVPVHPSESLWEPSLTPSAMPPIQAVQRDLPGIPRRRGQEVRGRVIIVRQSPNETMDFDPWRWLAIPVWGILLLLSPPVAAIIVWQSFGGLPALGTAACSLILLRFIFSDRLLQSWHLTAALNGHHIVESMPATMVRLRLQDSREVQLRLKGQVIGGTLIEGDRISASGSWRSGVLYVKRIHCERTGAVIIPIQPCARMLALIGLGILILGALWLYFAGIPWVSGQLHSFQVSLEQKVHQIQPAYHP